jgi:predicted outer membrane repeat protein
MINRFWKGKKMSKKRIGSFCVLVMAVLFSAAAKAPAQLYVDFYSGSGGSVTNPGEGWQNIPGFTWVQIEASPDPDYVFMRWSCSDAHIDIDDEYANPTTIYVNASSGYYGTVWAYFASAHSTITIASGPGGSVTSPGEGNFTYDYGDTVTVVAEADSCHKFKRWWFDGSAAYGNPYTFTIYQDAYIEAQFEALKHTLDLSSTEGGSVALPGEGTFEYDCGEEVTLEAEAEPGYHFTYWSGSYFTTGNPETITMDRDYELEANFEPDSQQTLGLTVSSSQGGSVTVPGEGFFEYSSTTVVTVQAVADPNFQFAGWSGTAVDTGKVANPNAANTQVTVDGFYTLHAQFGPAGSPTPVVYGVYYVDDDAVNDPGPNDSSLSDPAENGSAEHPFDTIQEGINHAKDGNSVVVLPGIYFENINLQGKQITVTTLELYTPNLAELNDTATCPCASNSSQAGIAETVIDGNDTGTVVTFESGEDANCILRGFIITRGYADAGGGIRCYDSSPTIKNCVIVGNRAYRYNGGAIDSYQSAAVFENCTISGNYAKRGGGAIYCDESNVIFANCIIWDNTPDEILVSSGNDPVVIYSDVAGGSTGQGNIDQDPYFANPGYWADKQSPNNSVAPSSANAVWIDGDYHLMSCQGRFDTGTNTWVQDSVNSPCIDVGDPNSDYSLEPAPNGSCINMGAYGGTAEASKTRPRLEILYAFNLDTDPGWAAEGQWQYGQPLGAGGANGNPDPVSGATGQNVYGVNLAGDYNTVEGGPYSLTAGPFDCSGQTHVALRFLRWLNTDSARFIRNAVEASNDGSTWQVIWESSRDSDITDAAWQALEYNISAVAADEGAVWIRWTYTVLDRAYAYSGWNIDDIELRGL